MLTNSQINSHPLVSVIIPTYNRESLILRAIQSLDKQTFQDFEIFVVDDASTDSTEQIIKDLNHPKINYIKLEHNSGQCVSRNRGIIKAKGKYIGFLDSDDEWLPGKLEKQLEVFEKSSDENLGAVYCGHVEIDEVHNLKNVISVEKLRGNLYENFLSGYCPSSPTMFLVKKQALLDVNSFDEHLPTFVDLDLWLRVAQKGYTFDFAEEPLIVKYEHKGEQIAKNLDKRLKGLEIFSGKWGKEMSRVAGSKSYEKFRKNKVQTVILALVDNPQRNNRKEVIKSIPVLLKYKVFNSKLIVKIVVILLFGNKGLTLIKQKIKNGV